MKILSPTYPGSIFICKDCGALFSYTEADLQENCFTYCPVCHIRQHVNLDLSYNGEVKDGNDTKKE